jgi:hypothetical protein
MTVDISTRGQRYGSLVTAYSIQNGRDVACRCICSRLIHVAVADLVAGVVTSCGCMPSSSEYLQRHAELKALQLRETIFNSARRQA